MSAEIPKHCLRFARVGLALIIFVSVLGALPYRQVHAQTTLIAGDIAFVEYNSDGTDSFKFVALVDLAAGTQILFTDNGWTSANAFRTGEGIITWTAPVGGLVAGTVVNITTTPSTSLGTVAESGDLNFASSGDQLLAYQSSATFIAALNNRGAAVWQATAADTNTSALPQGLTNGTNAVALTEIDNAKYGGPTSGDKATLLAALNNKDNWSGDDVTNQTFTGTFTITGGGGGGSDTTPPTISSLAPADGATDAASTQNLVITFNETVQAGTGNITIHLASDNSVVQTIDVTSAAVTVSGAQVTINPPTDLVIGTAYYVNLAAGAIEDTAGNDFAGITDATTWNFTIFAPTITLISAVQGSGDTSAVGTFTVEAIVIGDYQTQGSGQLRGFFVQEEDADVDTDPATSEGIFVFCTTCPTAVAVGDKVQVTGATSEFFNMSQLTASTAGSVVVLSSGNTLPTPATIQLPVPGLPSGDLAAATAAINAYYEPFEGMLVTFPDTLSVSEYFELARYGQVILNEGGRPRQFTNANLPSTTGLIDHEIELASRTVILDDTDNRQNRPVDTPNTAYYHPVPGLSTSNFFRGGDTISNLTGVLHWSFAGQTGTDAWRIRPVSPQFSYAFTPVNTRPAVPNVGGTLKVASFNVLNYFLTIDTTSSSSTGACGASATLDCRGPDSPAEREQQQAKLTAALSGLDADVVGLIELENTPNVDPLAEIVADLNAVVGANTYAAIDTGVIGTDAIKVGLIYKSSAVTPIGTPLIDNDAIHNRPPLAQLFEDANGGRFTVVVNHFKSKGCTDATGADLDQLDGQGCYNALRVSQANALLSFVETIVATTGDPDVLVIGDLNSYAKEDPVTTLVNGGLTNLVAQFGGATAYSYLFDGQLGYLDHALASASLVAQVTGTADWHINADENPLFDYNDEVRDTGESAFEEESDVFPLYAANAFRTSDHDPVVIGLSLTGATPTATPTVTPTQEPTATSTATATATEEPTATSTPTATEEPTATSTPTATEEPTATSTATVTPTPTDEATATSTPTATATETETTTPTPTATSTDAPTATTTPTPTSTTAAPQITIMLDAQPDTHSNFMFTGNLGTFILDDPVLDDGDNFTKARTFNVAPGTYTVRRSNVLNLFVTAITCTPESSATVNLALRQVSIVVAAGDQVTCTFTIQRGVTIRARVFDDRVRSGVNLGRRNAADPWLEGWNVEAATSPTTIVASGQTVATSSGIYEARINYVRPGPYSICVTMPSGWTNTEPPAIDAAYEKPCKNVTLAPGQSTYLLFGVYQPTTATVVASAEDAVVTDMDQLLAYDDTQAEDEDELLPEVILEARPVFLPLIVR